METVRDQIVSQHTYLMEQLELKYMNYIQQLLTQKSKIIVKMQCDFYKELHTLNTLPISAFAGCIPQKSNIIVKIESDAYHIGIPPPITPQAMQTNDVSQRTSQSVQPETTTNQIDHNTVVTNTRREGTVPHPDVLEYCPNYVLYDARARKESKERISSHLQQRQKLVIKCIELTIAEIDALGFELNGEQSKYAMFEDNGEILSRALEHVASQIDEWDGVQVKLCKTKAKDGTPILIDTWQKFAKKAKNYQDQTSWKICGGYLFAPYIARFNRYISGYCRGLLNISSELRSKILCLAKLSFAQNLLNAKIKFHRTKLGPLIRHRTLVKSTGIHIELENLCPKLTIRKFIQNAKAKREQSEGKSNIAAGEFYNELIKYVQVQKTLVVRLLSNKAATKNKKNKRKRSEKGNTIRCVKFKCTHPGCYYVAAETSTLNQHMRKHTGDTPYKCNHLGCDYAAAQKKTLTHHIRKQHTVAQPYQCDICNKSFASAHGKKRHLCKNKR
eukprot:184021_1